MSSESGLEGSEGQSVYAATKAANQNLTRSWAKELGTKGVRVIGVAPGIMETTGMAVKPMSSRLLTLGVFPWMNYAPSTVAHLPYPWAVWQIK